MPKIAVHLHIYYGNQTDDLLRRLQNLSGYPYDLFVTIVEDNPDIKQEILSYKPDAQIWQIPNLGYDIGPFIDFLHHIDLDAYDYIVKIHTKRTVADTYCIFNKHRFNMATWREMLLDAVISKPAATNNPKLLEANEKIGMLGNSYLLTGEKSTYRNLGGDIAAKMAEIGLTMPQDIHFVAGTMFWVRAKLLKPFLFYHLADFKPSDKNIHDKTLAHLVERMFSLAVTAQGYRIKGVRYKSFTAMFWLAAIKRFLYQHKITHNNKQIIKICKIPVYYRKAKSV